MDFCQPGTSFTEQAKRVLHRAREEAQHFQHASLGTEHLLLALVDEGEGAAKILANLGIELHKVRNAVAFIVGYGKGNTRSEINLTSRIKSVIKLAVHEAHGLNHHEIRTEHLLLALVLEGEGIGPAILECLGISLEDVRRQTVQVLGQSMF